MNIQLLIKLVKLANNNPNENEANLAARKACKLIAEADYKFNESDNSAKNMNYDRPPAYKPSAKQHAWYSSPPPSSAVDWFKDFMDRARKDPRYRDMRQGTWEYPEDRPFTPPYAHNVHHPEDEKYYTRRKERGFGNSKRVLNCIKCKKDKQTIFIGRPEVFICNDCIWSDLETKL